ncbi:hypothetical protein [Pontibacter beigongshangensis]|uniref:hypothetical protein n=1 Tax=Pontibacter beigongshangensis TaxID=2574733 RepID=UPI00164FE113|nr:hypothetical protein [Pontibacter beigongshangensis]
MNYIPAATNRYQLGACIIPIPYASELKSLSLSGSRLFSSHLFKNYRYTAPAADLKVATQIASFHTGTKNSSAISRYLAKN